MNDQPTGWGGKPCPLCGSSDIAAGVNLTQTGQVHLNLGMAYKTGIFTGAEMLYGDLCRDCGSVLRFFVKNPKRNWVQL